MIRATQRVPAAERSQPAVDRVVLDFDSRHRRRVAMKTRDGIEFLLDLPEAVALKDGDRLRLEDGRLVEVKAALEPLAEIRAKDASHLLRIAWHLGNRHLPTELAGDRLLIRRDHVIEEMVRGLGGRVTLVSAPFDPEGGAYGQAHSHSESHSHSQAGDHQHEHHDAHGHD